MRKSNGGKLGQLNRTTIKNKLVKKHRKINKNKNVYLSSKFEYTNFPA